MPCSHETKRNFYSQIPSFLELNEFFTPRNLPAIRYLSLPLTYPFTPHTLTTHTHTHTAISYECIRTITTIYPNNPLIERAAQAVVHFVTASNNNNWKYLGINALGALVKINPKFVAEHQLVVIDCLDDPDETLKRKVCMGIRRMHT